jgi:hypothetical protein
MKSPDDTFPENILRVGGFLRVLIKDTVRINTKAASTLKQTSLGTTTTL